MPAKSRKTTANKPSATSDARPDLSSIRSHARQIQLDLNAIKLELDEMRSQFAMNQAEIAAATDNAATLKTSATKSSGGVASPC